jgi:hypothetical protein
MVKFTSLIESLKEHGLIKFTQDSAHIAPYQEKKIRVLVHLEDLEFVLGSSLVMENHRFGYLINHVLFHDEDQIERHQTKSIVEKPRSSSHHPSHFSQQCKDKTVVVDMKNDSLLLSNFISGTKNFNHHIKQEQTKHLFQESQVHICNEDDLTFFPSIKDGYERNQIDECDAECITTCFEGV